MDPSRAAPGPSLLCLLWLFLIVRIIRIRTAQEQPLPVFESNVRSIRAILTVLCTISFNRDFGSRQQRLFREAAAQQNIGAAALDHPCDNPAVGPDNVHVNPRVRVDPLHLLDLALKFHRLIDVEFGCEGVMRPRRSCCEKQTEGSVYDECETRAHFFFSSVRAPLSALFM